MCFIASGVSIALLHVGPPRWRSIHQKTSQDDDSNRFRSQSHRSDVSKEMLNGSVTTANGMNRCLSLFLWVLFFTLWIVCITLV